jgi:transposase
VPVDRRARRAKTDAIDVDLLLRTCLAFLRGEPRVCSMVPVPDEADEDARHLGREREELVAERVALTNRIGAILTTLGVEGYDPLRRDRLGRLRTALGEPLPANAAARILRLLDRLELVLGQISVLEAQRDAVLACPPNSPTRPRR